MTTKVTPISCPINETQALFKDLDKPSLHALSYCLRHPDTWPLGFYWNYKNCNHCAMGLAHALWNSIPNAHVHDGASIMAKNFAMPYGVAVNIFTNGSAYKERYLWGLVSLQMELESVTPEMVADQIDLYLATAE